MKKLFLLLPALMLAIFTKAQTEENEFVESIGSGTLNNGMSVKIVKALTEKSKDGFIDLIEGIVEKPQDNFIDPKSEALSNICRHMSAQDKEGDSSIFAKIEAGKRDYAVIFLYRNMKMKKKDPKRKGDQTEFDVDLESLNTLIYHKTMRRLYDSGRYAVWNNYLLATEHIYLVYIDRSDAFFETNEALAPKSLAKTTIKINYNTSFLRQSFNDLRTVVGDLAKFAEDARPDSNSLQITIVQVDPKRVKSPCDVVLTNKSFNEDKKFVVHERNLASFQVGLVNNKFNRNNFALTDGKLVVTPDSAQTEEWKSNFYALIEMHWPRDIDNFQPVWKTAFARNNGRGAWHWLYTNTVYRMGIYGGLKISTDPLSNIYGGLNYAISKELYVNFGLTWANEVVPQVTTVAGVTSLDDARKYAKREYGKPTFSWGLSFAPSQIISMLGIGDD